ncbi:MAG: hypothetical protein CM15mP120_22900 [Pseudomonadota bacterium]|nr:MAG: hypothetical protein CM15mP120_22900 [Pseudomonadota bacterium]
MDRGRALGVEALIRGRLLRVHANEEVILSAGAINSPQLLMLSGSAMPTICARWVLRQWLTQPVLGRI